MTHMAKLILGVFKNRVDAESAIETLDMNGYDPKDISVMMKDEVIKEVVNNTGESVLGGTASGVATGGVLGALAGLLVVTGVVPGLGALLIGGPLAAALGLTGVAATAVSGAATGAIAGGIVGALTGLGLSEEDAQVYEQTIRSGGILLAVPSLNEEEDEIKAVMENNNAEQIKTVESPVRRIKQRDDGFRSELL